MDAKDFIFPGVILGLVIIVGIGLLLTHTDRPTLVNNIASSTVSSTTSGTVSPSTTSTTTPAPQAVPEASGAHPYGQVTLALGQAAAFADGTSIRPMHILEDSRCPIDVQCIQAGTVKLSVTVVSGGKTSTQTLSIGHSVKIGSDTITFDSVTPQKKAGAYPAAADYRFTFTVTH